MVADIAENIEFHMIITEPQDISLLQLHCQLVFLTVPSSHQASVGHCPAVLILSQVSVQVSSWCTNTCTPDTSLLDFNLKHNSIQVLSLNIYLLLTSQ